MAKRMLVDATHPEETRVAIVDGQRLDDLDFEIANRKMLKGNIYLAKVIRVEPSLQAAFVEYGGNRHGFLAFSEIHPDYYRIPVGDRPESDGDDADEEDLANAPVITEGPGRLAFEQDEDAETPTAEQAAENSSWADEEVSQTPPLLTSGFPAEPNSSLISDFSQPDAPAPEAAVEGVEAPVVLAETSVETVGGEVADHAPERFARPRRINYKIQEVIKRRQVMLIQVVKEERGNKGAALTTFLSLAGRYCVLMPNTSHGGGVSRKITNHQDRRRMKEILDQLEVPDGMALILRTAGMEQEISDIQRDLDYLLRLWNNIREQTLQSTAPALIYEEADLIKRTLRDLYSKDIEEVLVAGEEGFNRSRDFMRMLIPDAIDQIKRYDESGVPLFFKYQVENQIDALHNSVVQLRSGGYLVISPTEALVAIDVNSGRATRERHIEETALKTNLEAAEEIGRQLRLRDLAGLVVIDFIDMEDGRNNAAVERRIKESMRSDRARLQIGRISHFGLLELSRQRLRPSLLETNFEKCPHCLGLGFVRATESTALSVLRKLEEEGIKNRGGDYMVKLPPKVAFYILNQKRDGLANIQARYNLRVEFDCDEDLPPSEYHLDRLKNRDQRNRAADGPAVNLDEIMADSGASSTVSETADTHSEPSERRPHGQARRERAPRREPRHKPAQERQALPAPESESEHASTAAAETQPGNDGENDQRPRRRGRRGGRRRGRQHGGDRPDNRGPRPSSGGDNWQPEAAVAEGHANGAPAYSAPMPTNIPTSVHELDTTPREDNRSPSMSSSAYESINQPPDNPKGGWWRRLTGQ
ncbi:MAG: ribonuclease E/G [Alphaproteobacteria bacterium]